jgi:hypothetical protein
MSSAWIIAPFLSVAIFSGSIRQGDAVPKPQEPRKGDFLAVTGCINGPTVEERDTGRSYRLTGDKALVKEISKVHVGHIDEVSGILKSIPTSSAGGGKQVGRTRIRIGVVESRSAPDRAEPMPVLSVKSFRHLDGVCAR